MKHNIKIPQTLSAGVMTVHLSMILFLVLALLLSLGEIAKINDRLAAQHLAPNQTESTDPQRPPERWTKNWRNIHKRTQP